ncbi:LON peptidase substrate-binding domain-containing protein [Spirochaetota bacterium]
MGLSKSKIFYLKKRVVFPFCSINVLFALTKTSKDIKIGDRIIAYPIRNLLDIFIYKNKIGTLSEVIDKKVLEKGIKIQLKGIERVKIKKIDKLQTSSFEKLDEKLQGNFEKLNSELKKKSQELIFLINIEESDKLIDLLNYLVNIIQTTDFITHYFVLDFKRRYKLFKELNIEKRINSLISILDLTIDNMRNKRKTELP